MMTNSDRGFLRISSKISLSLKKRVDQIKVLLMEVDGTMTHGGVTLLSQTEDVVLEINNLRRARRTGSHTGPHRSSHGLHHWTPKLCSPS